MGDVRGYHSVHFLVTGIPPQRSKQSRDFWRFRDVSPDPRFTFPENWMSLRSAPRPSQGAFSTPFDALRGCPSRDAMTPRWQTFPRDPFGMRKNRPPGSPMSAPQPLLSVSTSGVYMLVSGVWGACSRGSSTRPAWGCGTCPGTRDVTTVAGVLVEEVLSALHSCLLRRDDDDAAIPPPLTSVAGAVTSPPPPAWDAGKHIVHKGILSNFSDIFCLRFTCFHLSLRTCAMKDENNLRMHLIQLIQYTRDPATILIVHVHNEIIFRQ